jgi:hypothetical protein
MSLLSALVVAPVVLQTPALPEITLDSLALRGFAIERVDSLRCMLLQRDHKAQARLSSCPEPPAILGQWRN